MSRSSYKNPFLKAKLLKNKKRIQIHNKNLIILPEYINNFIKIYNGKVFISLKITENMIGYKFGEFIYTRKRYIYKKK